MPRAFDGAVTYEVVDLTTLAEVRTHLDASDSADTSTDSIISALISDVSSEITSYLGWHTLKAAREEIYHVKKFQRILSLDARPVDTATETPGVRFHINTDFSLTTDIDSTRYAFNEPLGYIRFLTPPNRDSFCQVDYTGGLAASAADVLTNFPEIAHAATMQVKYAFQRRDSLGGNVETFAGSTSFDRAYNLLPSVRRILDKHKRGGF